MASGDASQKKPYRLTENLAEELSLREGQLLRARVVSRFAEDDAKLLIELKGRKVVARSHLDVAEDQTLLVRVKSLDHPIELQLFEPSETGEELSDNDLRNYLRNRQFDDSDESVEFLKTWLEESLPLDEQQFEKALENREMIVSGDSKSSRDRMWGFCFLEERGFPVDPESLELVGNLRSLSGDSETWTRFCAENAGSLALGGGGLDVESSVSFVGFDLVNRFGKRPREASKTLHAKLLKELKDGTSELSVPPDRLKSLLGQILGVALVNLENREEFLFFVPLLREGRVEPAWVGGRRKTGESSGWYMNVHLTLPQLGPVEVKAERSPSSLRLSISVNNDETSELLRNHVDELKSSLSDDNCTVTVTIVTEEPRRGFDAFDLSGSAGSGTRSSFSKGLDLTV